VTRIGVLLPTFDPFRHGRQLPIVEFAQRTEEYGFTGIWTGDHLWCPSPVIDAVTSLAACAAVTSTIDIGLSVMLLGMRPPAWSAKQIATLQHLSGNRVRLGVGVGGEFPEEYQTAGVPLKGRGARLDRSLEALPGLLSGQAVVPASGPGPAAIPPVLEPTAPMPPLLVGGRSDAAMRRAIRFGGSWMPMWMSPDTVARRFEHLKELAGEQGRETPRLALVLQTHVEDDRERGRREADGHLRGQYGMELDRVERWTALGGIEEIADLIERYIAVGVEDFVLMQLGSDQLGQLERLAKVLGRLPSLTQPARIPG